MAMDRKSRWMEIPYPFPEPEIRYSGDAPDRAALAPPLPRPGARPLARSRAPRRRVFRRWLVGFYVAPWRALACSALLSLALASLAWLAWRAFR
jgi:hypothetical protein